MATILVKNLSKKYPTRQALKDVSFEIADKELTVITGMRESGKTTLIRAICGLDAITLGEVYIDGVLVNKLEPKDRNIAVIMDQMPLNLNASVYDNIATGMKLRKYPKEEIESKVGKAAELLGLSDYLRRLTKNLTPGQKFRTLLARAVSREPKLVIIDDMLKGVEVGLKKELRTEIVKLNKRLGINFIYCTDNPTDALTMADKIVFLEEGVMTQCAAPRDIYDKPNTLPIATFFGSPKINLFQGFVVKKNDKYFASFQGFEVETKQELSENFINKYVDKKRGVTFAVRAEDFVLDDNGAIFVAVDECDKWAGEKFVSVLSSDSVEEPVYFNAFLDLEKGTKIRLTVKPERLLIYDTENEMLLG